MSILQTIEQDYLAAYKAKDEPKKETLRMLKSSILNLSIEKRETLSDEEIWKLLRKEIKQRQDSCAQYAQAGRNDLAQKEEAEISVLSHYLPQELNEEEIVAIIDQTIDQLSPIDPSKKGQVIGAVMQRVKGRADGGRVAQLVNQQFENKK